MQFGAQLCVQNKGKKGKGRKGDSKYVNPYNVLGISNGATSEETKSAFRRLAEATHPDLNGGDFRATDQFREVAEADLWSKIG